MRQRKVTAIILAICLVLTMTPTMVFAETPAGTDSKANLIKFYDVNGHWASEAVNKWAGYGVVKGDDRGFRPDDPITRAEMAVILDNLMGYQAKSANPFSDVKNGAWYADAVLKANAAEVLQGDTQGNAAPTANITREQAAVMLARAFGVDENSGEKTSFNDRASIASWARPLVFGMEANKYIGGMGDWSFAPKANVTRAQVVTMIDNAVKAYYTAAGTYKEDVKPETAGANAVAIVKVGGVIIKDAKISGDLIIAEGVGEGEFTLDGTNVTGKMITRGGGENSILIINGAAVDGKVIVEKRNGALRIVSDGVELAYLQAETEVILVGNYENVTIGEGAVVEIRGNAANVIVETKATVTVDKDAKVGTLTVQSEAEGAKVTVSGTLTEVKTEAQNTEIVATETARIAKIEATSGSAGTNIEIDKKAQIKTLSSDAEITVTGEGTVQAVEGTGSVTNQETGASIQPSAPISGGGGGGSGSRDRSSGAEAAPVLTSATIYKTTAKLNESLKAVPIFDKSGGTASYQWYRATGSAINTASDTAIETNGTGAAYILTADDVGSYIYCVVTAAGSTTGGSKNTNIIGPVSATPAQSVATLQSLGAYYTNDTGDAIDLPILGFSPTTTSYAVTIYEPFFKNDEHIDLVPVVTPGSNAVIEENNGVDIANNTGTARVIVAAEDGRTTNRYDVSFKIERRHVVIYPDRELVYNDGVDKMIINVTGTNAAGTYISGDILRSGTVTVKDNGTELVRNTDYSIDLNKGKISLFDDTEGKHTIELIIETSDGLTMSDSTDIYLAPTWADLSYDAGLKGNGTVELYRYTLYNGEGELANKITGSGTNAGSAQALYISGSAIEGKRINSVVVDRVYQDYSKTNDLTEEFIMNGGWVLIMPFGTTIITISVEDVIIGQTEITGEVSIAFAINP
ncbi:S-layer homology domain-containing protein [Sinanaerobacter chloroacetimidivorans]|uniref:S-layer homology domain-containing protein n=1 Tax=Sinanaerobacter chloroacetimidivorans TaxID=2818044 RepID=A0A8J7W0M3_9FIRM|nr:S-layer homology domain-containing protein [Sinanaerobacter chloroacetimidivorans]MBR0598191.1 S-layer homology domain-containing protein [Sinanaerobacter chloroacetimidivorans]